MHKMIHRDNDRSDEHRHHEDRSLNHKYTKDLPVDAAFTTALPKAELHAHLTGSISPACLHEIWQMKRAPQSKTNQDTITTTTGSTATSPSSDLADPLLTIRPDGAHQDIISFFVLFDSYIYNLCNDISSIRYATSHVLQSFEDDGVAYLELRTTPRENLASGMTKAIYIHTVLDVISSHSREKMSTYLILSIDRRMTLLQAEEVVDLAIQYQHQGVVGVDLCGNPNKGDVSLFAAPFQRAREAGLKITLHFAEVPNSSTESELRTLLSYRPDRIGHVIHVPEDITAEIEERKIGLELCLSCNVHAKMLPEAGGFDEHHFRHWRERGRCSIALSTDDVGVFGSPLSNEYLLAAQHFGLSRKDMIELSRSAIMTAFANEEEKARFERRICEFGKSS